MAGRDSILDYPMSTEKNVQEDKIDTARLNDKEKIPIMDSFIVTEDLLGRLDVIILNKYNRLDVLPMILDYNNLESINDLNVGDYVILPDIGTLNDNTEILQELETFEVPGVAVHDYDTETKEQAAQKAIAGSVRASDSDKATGVPKLEVIMPKVKYESETGKLIF